MRDIAVSVYITTYNHEKYLSYALESVLMQKVNFNIEVLVGDDASTDGTANIMRKYEADYPGFFTMIYRKKNMYRDPTSIGNGRDLVQRCKGKYIIALEGDDFWTDPNKLQKQYNFLESHSDYIAVAHNTIVVDENNKKKDETYPECKEKEYSINHFLYGIFPGQLATVMCRNYYIDTSINISILQKRLIPGDRLRTFVLCGYGKIRCFQETMSAYRHVTSGGSSYSATYQFDYQKWNNYYEELMRYALEENTIPVKNKIVAEVLFIETIFSGIKHRVVSMQDFISKYRLVKHKARATLKYLIYFVRKK